MKTIIDIYQEIFPHTTMADWFYALLGLLLHAVVKLKNVRFKDFKGKTFFGEFLPVWYFAFIAIFILVGGLPEVMTNYNVLDSALIGYSSSSIIKQLFKSKTEKLNIL